MYRFYMIYICCIHVCFTYIHGTHVVHVYGKTYEIHVIVEHNHVLHVLEKHMKFICFNTCFTCVGQNICNTYVPQTYVLRMFYHTHVLHVFHQHM